MSAEADYNTQDKSFFALQDGGEGEVDPFVELEISDPAGSSHEVHTSPIIMNEPSPRWNIKYDYIMVSATSSFTATVWDKQGLFDSLLSLKTLLGTTSVTESYCSVAWSFVYAQDSSLHYKH